MTYFSPTETVFDRQDDCPTIIEANLNWSRIIVGKVKVKGEFRVLQDSLLDPDIL